jgi:nitrite reductase/ring-hydroxylating ferredoxin subunit
VFPAADLNQNGRTVVTINRREIAVFAVGGQLYAVFNRCPHQQAPLAAGSLGWAAVPTEVGKVGYDRSRPILHCPWHRYEFDLHTGRCVGDPDRLRVATYDAHLEGDEIAIYLTDRR